MLSPEPGWQHTHVRYKRHGTTSHRPPTQISHERTPMGEIDLGQNQSQDEWHKIARPRPQAQRNGPWPETRSVPGLFDPYSPEEPPRYLQHESMQPFTSAWTHERNVALPPWIQDFCIRTAQQKRDYRRIPPSGANEPLRPPRSKLRMTRADSCQERLEE